MAEKTEYCIMTGRVVRWTDLLIRKSAPEKIEVLKRPNKLDITKWH
jgi:hypothetical protein